MDIPEKYIALKNEMMDDLGLSIEDINASANPVTNTHFARKTLHKLETFIRNAHENAETIAAPDPILMKAVGDIADTRLGSSQDVLLARMVADYVLYAHINAYGKPSYEQQECFAEAKRVLFDILRNEPAHTQRLSNLKNSFDAAQLPKH